MRWNGPTFRIVTVQLTSPQFGHTWACANFGRRSCIPDKKVKNVIISKGIEENSTLYEKLERFGTEFALR
jgi:hypothetical protein